MKSIGQRLREEIDLHIAAMLLFCVAVMCLDWWYFIVPLLMPQGRIYVRVFWDYPAFGRRPWAYLVINELLVFGTVSLFVGLRVGFLAIRSFT